MIKLECCLLQFLPSILRVKYYALKIHNIWLGLMFAGQNDYCDTITIAKSTVAILLLLQVPIAILLL